MSLRLVLVRLGTPACPGSGEHSWLLVSDFAIQIKCWCLASVLSRK